MTDPRVPIADVMVGAMAREIVDGDVVGVGLGTPLAVVAALVARATHAPGSHVLAGGAVDPWADVATCLGGPTALAGRTTGFVPHLDTMDMAERQSMTLQFLRPAQVDGAGNLNTSRIGPRARPTVRFPGGLATGDVPLLLPRLVIYLPDHRARNLPDRVACVTGAAGGWTDGRLRARGPVLLVTNLCVFAFTPQGAVLRSVHPGIDVDAVRADTGFSFAADGDVPTTAEPSVQERAALEVLDPAARRVRELRAVAGAQGRLG